MNQNLWLFMNNAVQLCLCSCCIYDKAYLRIRTLITATLNNGHVLFAWLFESHELCDYIGFFPALRCVERSLLQFPNYPCTLYTVQWTVCKRSSYPYYAGKTKLNPIYIYLLRFFEQLALFLNYIMDITMVQKVVTHFI